MGEGAVRVVGEDRVKQWEIWGCQDRKEQLETRGCERGQGGGERGLWGRRRRCSVGERGLWGGIRNKKKDGVVGSGGCEGGQGGEG